MHIEYYVVRVDEEGRTNFLADIYRYDRIRMGVDPEEAEPCEMPIPIEGEPVIGSVIWNDDGSAVTPDGTVIHANGTIEYPELPLPEGAIPTEVLPNTPNTVPSDGVEPVNLGP